MTAPAAPLEAGVSWARVLAALEARDLVTRRRGARHVDARCPVHEDRRASLTADYEAGDPGRTLLCCHANAGCSGADIAAALGLVLADLFDGPPPRSGRPATPRRRPAARSAAPSPSRVKCEHKWADAERYRYTYEDGEIALEVIRQACRACDAKNFPVRRPNGRGGWEWKWPVRRPLFRLPEVIAAVRGGRTVFVVEGEKDVLALERAGHVATCNPGGAGKWLAEHSGALAGAARVVVIADKDAPGYKHAAMVAAELAGTTDPPVSSVEVAEAAHGKDAYDHLAAGGTVETLVPCDPYLRLAELDKPPPVTRIGPEHPRPVEGSPGWQYTLPGDDGTPGAVERLMGQGKDREMSPVIKSCPRVMERLVTAADSSTRDRRHYTVRWGADEATVSYADLISGEAWDKFPDALGTGDKPVRGALANVVMTQGAELPRTVAATRTGWHADADGARYYLYADGRTYPPGRNVRLIGAPSRLAEAARPRGQASDAEIRQALGDIAMHGRFAGLLGLAAGARAFGQSIRPVPAALAVHGDPYAGKSLLGWHARSLAATPLGTKVEGWPPLPTKSFTSTRTDLEFAANFEADMPVLFEDLALPGNASAIEIREANGKLEALIRSLANQDEIRGRRSRDLLPGPANYVRSIPVITAERMPPTMMESLYRRAVVPRIRAGQIDIGWYKANSPRLLTPLRAIGDRIIAHLHELGDAASARLGEYGAAAYGVLGAAIGDAAWVADVPAMAGVVDAAAAILGGLYLVADVVPGVDPAALAEPVALYLAEALAEQAEVMADRHADAGSLTEAVAHVLTRALATRRAHVCDAAGRPAPLIPGMAASEQGLTDAGGMDPGYRGDGVALYWLPERGGIGMRSKALAALLAESRDPRAAGLTYRSLPEALLREDASIRNTTQKGRSAAHSVTIGGDDVRVILLRPEVLTGHDPSARSDESNGRNGRNGRAAGQGTEDDLSAPDREENGRAAGQRPDTADPPPASDAADRSLTSAVLVPTVPADREENGRAPGQRPDTADPLTSAVPVPTVPADPSVGACAPGRFAGCAVVVGEDGAWLAGADQPEPVSLPAQLGDLAAVLEWAAGLRLGLDRERGYPDDGVVVVMPELAARLGLPAAAPGEGTKAAQHHAVLGQLTMAGWSVVGKVAELRSWMAVYPAAARAAAGSSDRTRGLRLWLPGWDTPEDCPMLEGDPSALELAYRLGRFADLVGITWRLNGGPTGTDLALTFPRRGPRLIDQPRPPKPATVPTLETDCIWQRAPSQEESAAGWLHVYDANAMYLSAAGLAVVGVGDPAHVDAPAFDPKLPGYWRIDPPDWDNRFLPDLFDPSGSNAAHRRRGARWFTTPTLAYAAALGYELAPLEGWLYREHTRFYEPWTARIRDARAALMKSPDRDDAAVLAAVKDTYRRGIGMLAVPTSRRMFRPDHRHAIVSQARVTLLRKLANVGDREGRWPLAAGTDAVAYASADPDPVSACPAGLRIGAGLGEFKVYGSLPMAQAAPLLRPGGRPGELLEAARKWMEVSRDGSQA
jgi:hypothetical protein